MLLTVPGTCCCAIFANAECNGNWEEIQQCYIMLCLPWTSGLWQRRTLTHNGASGSDIQEFYTLTFNWLGRNDVLVSGQASPHMQDLLAMRRRRWSTLQRQSLGLDGVKVWWSQSQIWLNGIKDRQSQSQSLALPSWCGLLSYQTYIELSDLRRACNVAC